MSERERYLGDDVDWATAAEQSSEDDEAQEGDVLASEERAVTPAERVALHIEGDDDGDVDDEDIEFEEDPEADAIVNDALNLDQAAESEAAAEVLNDAVAEEAADREAAAADQRAANRYASHLAGRD